MLIGGLQPVTLLDYPHKISAIIFTAGCNMRCPFCYNYQLVLPELIHTDKLYEESQIINFLKNRKKYLEGLVISGGEPTLQPDLISFLKKIKKIGYQIKLDTNGLMPDVLASVIDDNLVDYVAMDIKGPADNYKSFSGVEFGRAGESIKLIMNSGLPYEFRSTLIKKMHQLEDMEKMSELIVGAENYYLQNYLSQPVLAGDNFKGRSFTTKELENFKSIAEKKVKNCIIRN